MQIEEFKAWFEGFCENIESAPTAEQFAKIKAKIGTLSPPVAKANFRTPIDQWAPVVKGPRLSDEYVVT